MSLHRGILLSVFVAALILLGVSANTTDDTANLDIPPPAANPPALLKHLTPIAGTNLFLNTQYKWHDHTKPGCYAMWFEEWFRGPEVLFPSQFKGLSMVCNKDDQQWYDTTNANWIFERTEGEEGPTEYDGTVKIRNVGTGLTLETWISSDVWWVGIGGYAADPSEDQWNVRSDPENKNNLQLEIQKWWITQRPSVQNRAYLALKKNEPAGYPYHFVPEISLSARMYDFVFEQPMDGKVAELSTKKQLIDSYEINNSGPGSASRTIEVSEKVVNEFSWGFSESLKNFAKVTGSVGVPFIASSEIEAGFELTLSANQQWKNSVEKEFKMSYTVNVPENANMRISAWYDLVKGISMDYTATTEISGNGTRITVFNDIVKDSPATGEMIRKHLEYTKFDGTVVEIKEYSVIAQIKGTMVASVGVRGQLNVDGKAIITQIVPK